MQNLVDRFLKYIKIYTTSDENSDTIPSTKRQLVLAEELKKELIEIGLDEVSLDENGYLMATIPSNIEKNCPVIGFIAHMDTSPDMSGENVKSKIINYNGEKIILNAEKNIYLDPKDFPSLNDYNGKTIITTDGTTLLGADDKAGIAEIITASEILLKSDIKHGKIRICFTPDEEIGRGADFFDVKKFGADFAYTIDGGPLGELESENFNAASAKFYIQGKNVHPGAAKDQMINSILIANELISLFPKNERPENTEKYEGFFHINDINGSVEKTTLNMIIRDHDKELFEQKKDFVQKVVEKINKKYSNAIKLELKDSYYNMKEIIEKNPHIMNLAKKAFLNCDVTPNIKPIRGGTDGARLSFMGLPCPNIFTGGHNFHGKYEYVVIESMEKAVQIIVEIAKLNTEF
ncbi:peptidase T [Oceanotoga sp. DSM 15011]|uniref:peptidase T n=1 Tax=Oceanotoga sp. DSM 15011 TaxID=2984951 RepID=UPI0021F44426|nr:peptidase T [Oceanotoga sp. DSM 15011]UYP00256.1 peptidase T [Oceanotoga sp. DSM 15011]